MTIDSNNSNDNNDIKQHLQNIEARLDRLAVSPQLSFGTLSGRHDDEIDLREIWNILWGGKWWIIGITFLFAVLGVFYALSLPNQYKAEAVFAPAQEQTGGMSGLAAQYGGLAAMAGISLGGGRSSDVDQAIALLKSWPFLDGFVKKYELKPEIMAVNGWNAINDKATYDEEIYNPEVKKWVRKTTPKQSAEPTSYEVYKVFSKMLSVTHDSKTGLIKLSVEHYVPRMTDEWLRLLVQEINRHFQERDIKDAKRNIEYLEVKISETSIADMKAVFFRMVEEQMKTLMLAEASEEYLFASVIPAVQPEDKSGPSRMLICLVALFLGWMVGIAAIIFKAILRNTYAG